MALSYTFKRNIFYNIINSLNNSNIVFLLGPRKCGKTVAMLQVKDFLVNAIYIDIKSEFDDTNKVIFINDVVNSIKNNENKVYLIDEVTYLTLPDKSIAKIAEAYTETYKTQTKVVFSGSQSKALEYWGNIAFAGNASYIYADFLSYPEWLAYKNLLEPSIDSYHRFLLEVDKFYDNFIDLNGYLKGCLDETVISNKRAVEIIYNNDYDDLTVEQLLDVLYAALITRHNHTKYETFSKRGYLEEELIHFYTSEYLKIGAEELSIRINNVLRERYLSFKSMSITQLKKAIKFLVDCGLIIATYVSDTLDVNAYANLEVLRLTNNISKTDLFEHLNITIKYPMFYIALLKLTLRDDMPEKLNSSLVGSISECHIRGLLPTKGSFEYHDITDNEIDYVNFLKNLAIEFTISNKNLSKVNFSILPEIYRKILLTKDIADKINGIERIPYYLFIYDNSDKPNPNYKTNLFSN